MPQVPLIARLCLYISSLVLLLNILFRLLLASMHTSAHLIHHIQEILYLLLFSLPDSVYSRFFFYFNLSLCLKLLPPVSGKFICTHSLSCADVDY